MIWQLTAMGNWTDERRKAIFNASDKALEAVFQTTSIL